MRSSRRRWQRRAAQVRDRPQTLIAALLLGAMFVLLGTAIVAAEGFESPDPELNDSGVWITREDQRRVGRMNVEINTIDISLEAGSTQFDVMQSGPHVFVRHVNPSRLLAVDPARAITIGGPELPESAQVQLGGDWAAVLDPTDGSLYVVPSDELVALKLGDTERIVEKFDGPTVLAVGVDGAAYVYVSERGEVVRFEPGGDRGEVFDFPVGLDAGLTAVGGTPVILDRASLRLHFPDRPPVEIGSYGEIPLLQPPGPASGDIVVAFDQNLVRVPLADSPSEVVWDEGTGSPAVPIVVRGCAYGAWGGNGSIVRVCGDAEPESAQYGELGGGSSLRFRTNYERVVLNELRTGKQVVWGDGDPVFVDYWGEAFTNEEPAVEECVPGEEGCVVDRSEVRPEENRPPIATNDEAGTRPGRSVVVRPLGNDVDPDGDVLVIESIEPPGEGVGTVDIIEQGRALQVKVEQERPTMSFEYTITDGHGHESEPAIVTVTVYGEDQNRPPVPGKRERTTVVAGGVVTHDVLVNAFEPEGDPMSVLAASSASAASVRFEVGGELTITAPTAPEPFEVEYVLSDDRDAEATGVLSVTVVAREANHPPDARDDYARAAIGEEIVVDVLLNDSDANGDTLRVVGVEAGGADAIVTFDELTSEVRVRSDAATSVNVQYTVTDGQDPVKGLLRVDVKEATSQFKPVAVRDDVLVSTSRPAFLSVLDNDVDLDGDVLVIVGLNAPQVDGIDVDVVNRELLRITATSPLPDTVEFTYEVSDGSETSVGQVFASPAPPLDRNQPPIATPNEFKVRAGGIAYLPVVVDDSDPDGDPLELIDPPLVPDADALLNGRLFITEAQLRYQAPPRPKSTVFESYTIKDTASNTASAPINIHVLEAEGVQNSPPEPPTLTGRTVSGGSLTISIPLTTMDPEADIVTFVGLDSPPGRGIVTEIGIDELVYRADGTETGTDSFRYRVRDQFGLEATGVIRIGIAGRSSRNLPPIANADEYTVAPGTTARIPVLANDVDPDGDPIFVSDEEEDAITVSPGTVEIGDDDVLSYTVPADVADGRDVAFSYVVRDNKGATDTATVTLTVVRDAENHPPEPVDDVVEPAAAGTLIAVAVLENDRDPDPGDTLTVVATSLPDAQIEPLTGNITFTMPARATQFTYVVSDGTDERRAAVFVPVVAGGRAPVTGLDIDEVPMGGSVTVPVLENDRDPEGEELVLVDVVAFRKGSAYVDGSQVVFTATADNYVGDAGFAYIVANPSRTRTAIGFAQIRIIGEVNEPPTFTRSAIEVPQEGQRELQLTNFVDDPNDGDSHEFSDLTGVADGVTASLEGSALRVEAARDATPGTVITLSLVVSDGQATATGEVQVTVTSNETPLAQPQPDEARTLQGQSVTLHPLDNDINPFPGEPLQLIGADLDDDAVGLFTIQPGSAELVFSPAADRRDLGQVTFTYTVADASGDPNRNVQGVGVITVVGRPDIPAPPVCGGVESGQVQVTWTPPGANGAPITEYRIRILPVGGAPSERTFDGGASVQLVDGLVNGIEHTFQVAAVNEAVQGEPEFSPSGNTCKPDQVPDRPAPPITAFGDGFLDITFVAPPVDGSPVTELILINTTTGVSKPGLGALQTAYRWEELENGTSYRFQLVAKNEAGESEPSDLSTGDSIPAGIPLTALPPTTIPDDQQVRVNWTHSNADDNGDRVVQWTLSVLREGVAQPPVLLPDGAARSHVYATDNGVEYRFALQATNKAGTSVTSPLSDVAISSGPPFHISSISATEGDGQSQLTFDAPDENGSAILDYEYRLLDGAQNPIGDWVALPASRLIGGLNNGAGYHFQVRAFNANGHAGLQNPNYPTSNAVSPFGKPGLVTGLSASATGTGQMTWTWSRPSDNGRPITGYQVSYDGQGWIDIPTNVDNPSYTPPGTYWFEQHSLQVRAVRTPDPDPRSIGDPSATISGNTGGSATVTIDDTISGSFPGHHTGFDESRSAQFPTVNVSWSNRTFFGPYSGWIEFSGGCAVRALVAHRLQSVRIASTGAIVVTVIHTIGYDNPVSNPTECLAWTGAEEETSVTRTVTIPPGQTTGSAGAAPLSIPHGSGTSTVNLVTVTIS